MSKRDIFLLLDDMLQSALKIKRYTKDLDFESFLSDEKTIDAVVRNFEIIGEVAKRIDPDFKENNPEIEWKRIRVFRLLSVVPVSFFGRNRAIHQRLINADAVKSATETI